MSDNYCFKNDHFSCFIKAEESLEEKAMAETAALSRRQHIHRTIRNIVKIAPTALFELFPVLTDFFPHKRHPLSVQVEYTSQILELCEAFPSLQQKVMGLILGQCLEMDVDIVIEDSGEVRIHDDDGDGDDGGDGDGMFQLDDNDIAQPQRVRVPTGGSSNGGGISAVFGLKISDDVAVVETADKLDAILVLVLEYIRKCAYNWGIVNVEGTEAKRQDSCRSTQEGHQLWKKLFFQLVDVFEVKVMTTYKSKFVQFVLFHMCELDPSLGE